MTEPESVETYRPFPGFADWASLPVDTSTFDGYAAVLDDLRAQADTGPLNRAVEFATRAAAIDTGAIEGLYEVDRGFTMTVAIGSAAWEAVIAAREPIVRRSFEDALRAYDYVLDLATTRTEVTEKAVREIHQTICGSQDTYRVVTSLGVQERPLPRGEYKEMPNNPVSRLTGRVHPYAPPIDVPAEMHRLVRELRTETFRAAHPVLQAAYAHYAFVAVHPFADGNGRVARALASVFLYRRPGVPLVIFADQKDAYLDGLEAADDGRPERFVRFVEERVVDVTSLVQVSARAPADPTAASLASLRETFLGADGIPVAELDRHAGRLRELARTALVERLASLDLPAGVGWFETDLTGVAGAVAMPERYRPASSPGHPLVVGLYGPGVHASVAVEAGFSAAGAGRAAFQLIPSAGGSLQVELREIFPTTTSVLGLKVGVWADTVVARLVAEFDATSRAALRPAD